MRKLRCHTAISRPVSRLCPPSGQPTPGIGPQVTLTGPVCKSITIALPFAQNEQEKRYLPPARIVHGARVGGHRLQTRW